MSLLYSSQRGVYEGLYVYPSIAMVRLLIDSDIYFLVIRNISFRIIFVEKSLDFKCIIVQTQPYCEIMSLFYMVSGVIIKLTVWRNYLECKNSYLLWGDK